MKENKMDRFIGKYCKIVCKQPDMKKTIIIKGTIKQINPNIGLIFVESDRGLSCVNMKNVTAIKPSRKKK